MKSESRKASKGSALRAGAATLSTTSRTGKATTSVAGAVECAEAQRTQGPEFEAETSEECRCTASMQEANSSKNRHTTASHR